MEKEHIEILLEDMQSKFELVLEGLGGLHKKVDDHQAENQEKFDMLAYMIECLQKKNGEFEKRFDAIDQKHRSFEQRFDEIDQRFDNLEGHFDKLEGRFDKLDADFAAHRVNTEIHTGYTVNENQKGHEYR